MKAITYDEWQKALESAQLPSDGDGKSTLEWASSLGLGVRKGRQWVADGEREGWLKKGVRVEERLGDGAQVRRYVWSLAKKTKRKGGK